MLKYINYLFGLMLLFSQDNIYAADKTSEQAAAVVNVKTVEVTNVSGKEGNLEFRSIKLGDPSVIVELITKCEFKEGLPDDKEKEGWAKNLLVRHLEVGNPYSGVVLLKDQKPIGFLTIGVMPAVGFGDGYKLGEHQTIIDTFFGFGAIKKKEKAHDAPTNAPHVYEQVDNGGLGFLLPILPESSFADNNDVLSALKIGLNVFQELKNRGKRLPRGLNTIPGTVMGLFHPDDRLVKGFESIGFTVLRDEGFKKFYDNDRVLVYKKLRGCPR